MNKFIKVTLFFLSSFLVLLIGSFFIFIYFGISDFSIIGKNPFVFFIGSWIGLISSYISIYFYKILDA